jgi:hypothetical protein
MSSSIDPLVDSIQQFPFRWLIAVTILPVFCAWWVAFRRLTEMRMQLDKLRRDIVTLERQYSSLLVRQLNLPKPRSPKARKLSSPSSDLLEETEAAPIEPDGNNSKGSAPYVVAPKTSLE